MALTQTAFDLLLARLDPDRQLAAEKYELLRKRLIKFFEWQHCANAEACADEAIDRVAKNIDRGEEIRDPVKYFNRVARLIAYEVYREREKQANLIQHLSRITTVGTASNDEEGQIHFDCMKECLHKLSSEKFELITRYYQPGQRKENRMKIADQMRIHLNVLRIRVHRIRTELKECYIKCLQCKQN